MLYMSYSNYVWLTTAVYHHGYHTGSSEMVNGAQYSTAEHLVLYTYKSLYMNMSGFKELIYEEK